MPAKPLTPEQKADADRLKAAFRAWQEAQRDKGSPVSQIEAASRLGFGQSALSQYLNGAIPLNGPVLARFAELIGAKPEEISPAIAEQEARRSQTWAFRESALQHLARETFLLRGIEAEPEAGDAELPQWLQETMGRTYRPDLFLTLPDGTHAWVEVKSPQAVFGIGQDLMRLQVEHPREFLLLVGEVTDMPRIIDGWLQLRDKPELPAPGPDRHRLRNQRAVPVIGTTQGGLPARVWGDEDQPVGGSDEYTDVSSTDAHAFACKVVGESMVPRYMPGEYALVEPSMPPEIEDDVLVRLATGETMLKRLLSRRGGVRLGSYNDTAVLHYRDEDITWMYYVAHPIPARRIKHRIGPAERHDTVPGEFYQDAPSEVHDRLVELPTKRRKRDGE